MKGTKKKKWKQFLQSIKCKMKWICWSLWLISFSAAWIFYLWKLFNSSFKQLQHDDDSVSISFSKSSILKYHWIYKEWTIASYSKTSDLHMSWNCSMSFQKKKSHDVSHMLLCSSFFSVWHPWHIWVPEKPVNFSCTTFSLI